MMHATLLAAVVFAAVFLTARGLHALVRAWRTRRVLSWVGDADRSEGWDHGEVVTLEGVLEVGSAIETFFPYGVALLDETTTHATTPRATGDASLAVGTRRVVFDRNQCQVVVGAEESGRGAKLRLRTGRTERVLRGMFRRVRAGDRVRMRGRLEKISGDRAASYRGEAAAFQLVPDPESDCAIPIVATRASIPKIAVLSHLVLACAAAGAVVWFVWRTDRDSVASVTAAPRGAPACRVQIDAAIARGEPWVAESLASACPDHTSAAWAAVAVGDVRTASDRFALADDAEHLAPTLTEVETYILGKNPARARMAFGRLVAEHFASNAKDVDPSIGCLDEALGRRAGALDAELGLRRALDTASHSDTCELMRDDFGLYSWRPRSSAGNLFLVERMPTRPTKCPTWTRGCPAWRRSSSSTPRAGCGASRWG